MAGIDINRTTENIVLPPEVSSEIWQKAQEQSFIQQRVRSTPLPGGGLDVPIITGDPVAEWVSETQERTATTATFGHKNIKGYTLSVTEPFSRQFMRDLPRLYNALVERMPGALAKMFDRTCFGFEPAPGSAFDTLKDAPGVSLTTPGANKTQYDSFLAALESVAVAGDSDVTGWALSIQAELAALGAKDTQGRPIFINSVTEEGSVGQVLARPAWKTKHAYDFGKAPIVDPATPGVAATLGIGGDWDSAVWGFVESLSIEFADQATIKVGNDEINLWSRKMVAVRMEFEVGFAVRDVNRFVRLTGPIPA